MTPTGSWRTVILTGPRRPPAAAAAALLVPLLVVVVMLGPELVRGSVFPPDFHAAVSLDEAIDARYCGARSAMSPQFDIAASVQSDWSLMPRPIRDLLVAKAGSLAAYCHSVTLPLLNNENSTGLLMRIPLWLSRSGSVDDIGRLFTVIRMSCLIVLAYGLLAGGASVALASIAVWSIARLCLDLRIYSMSVYSFLAPLLVLVAALYGIVLPKLSSARLPVVATAGGVAGFLTAFCVNVRSSHLPIYLCLFAGLIAGAAMLRPAGSRLVASTVAAAVFAFGFMVFTRLLIVPLIPEAPSRNYSYHPIAHPLVLALAVPPNPLSRREGIRWDDGVGLDLARRMDPHVTYLGPGYEQALYRYYRQLWRNHPGEMFDTYAVKLRQAGSGMFHETEEGLHREPMVRAIGWLAPLANGFVLLATYAAVGLFGAFRFYRGRGPLAFLLAQFAAIAVLLQVEAAVIMSTFRLIYDGYLLAFAFMLVVSAVQLLIDTAVSRAFHSSTAA